MPFIFWVYELPYKEDEQDSVLLVARTKHLYYLHQWKSIQKDPTTCDILRVLQTQGIGSWIWYLCPSRTNIFS